MTLKVSQSVTHSPPLNTTRKFITVLIVVAVNCSWQLNNFPDCKLSLVKVFSAVKLKKAHVSGSFHFWHSGQRNFPMPRLCILSVSKIQVFPWIYHFFHSYYISHTSFCSSLFSGQSKQFVAAFPILQETRFVVTTFHLNKNL